MLLIAEPCPWPQCFIISQVKVLIFLSFSFLEKKKEERQTDRIKKKRRKKKVMSKQVNQKKREMLVIGLGCGSVGKPSMCEALGLIPNTSYTEYVCTHL